MVDSIRVVARCPRIPSDNLEQFKKAAVQALAVAKDEATTLRYDWFFTDDETGCVAFEDYEDSTALLTHVGHLGVLFGTLLELAGDSSFEVFGNATAEVREAMAGLNVSFFPSYFQGK
jgi:hypothetical protein